ncbi:hypothetical protein H0A36_25790 [Endozoicomonas sp. SM1973]|uniref:Uncharacterized protein n=1 Tax=Spartinivicinus marinus TaxID=2994442 RepID=A0A853IC52_9GAMM|nr:hypothetical protein [Spartinivicinus marinus]MCX4030278.1 hypothetical protein [Spartinivicinus marinus]MCX4030419.1 hypothetical protein [Spartinivicinus marinus]NYZ69432.1 hypothetical protein [Spartinivicinus marinus]
MFRKRKDPVIPSCISAYQRTILAMELTDSVNNVVLTNCVMGLGYEAGTALWYKKMGNLIVPATMDFILEGALDEAGIDVVRNKPTAKK